MAPIEDRLKQYIKDNYGSIRAFVMAKSLNYANVDSILRRGIKNATWNSVKTLCEALEISADDLADEIITPVSKSCSAVRIENIIEAVRQQIMSSSNLTINNKPATQEDIMLFIDTLDIALEMAKKRINSHD